MEAGLHDGATWRISPTPFLLTSADLSAIQSLGQHLLRFTHALNRLYYESVRGAQPTWVADYLDQGKPPDLIAYARMNRFRTALPGVIRPDLILTEDGFMISELDSVPGGIGLTGCMGQAYTDLGWPIIGGRDGMIAGFARMIRSLPHDESKPLHLAIVVSEETGIVSIVADGTIERGLTTDDLRSRLRELLLQRAAAAHDRESRLSYM